MKCRDFRELIDSYLSDELLTETNHGVLHHLEQCADCRSVIEERRIFRGRLRSAVQNCQQFRICEKFNARLHDSLRQAVLPQPKLKRPFWAGGFSLAAATVGLLLIATVGFLFLRNSGDSPDLAVAPQNQPAYFGQIALGDHRSCAVAHDLAEPPVGIDLTQPQYADLREAVQMPLKNKFGRCELIDAHLCRYQGRDFTHLIFQPEGKTMSVLIMDLPDVPELKKDYIAKLSLDGYQIAYFDVARKGVFVISDLPEQQNFGAAETVETPLRRKFSENRQARLMLDFGF